MTKQEIVDTALKGVGKTRVQGNSMEPIMPYLLADIMYQIYTKDIGPIKLRHELKQMDDKWRKRYKLFNRPLFAFFPAESKDKLTDLMDSVGDHLANEVTMLRAGVMTAVGGIEDFDKRRIVSSFLLCHIFAQYAESSYQRCFYTLKHLSFGTIEEPASNKDLCYLRDLSYDMAMQYIKEIPGGELVINYGNMDSIFGLVAKKIYGWLKEN
jgi:hypothetical protein